MAGMREQVVKVRAELDNAVVVRPGDKLIVGLKEINLQAHDVERAKSYIGGQLPGVEVVVIPGAVALAVYRDDPRIIQRDEPLSAEKLDRIRAELAETLPGE